MPAQDLSTGHLGEGSVPLRCGRIYRFTIFTDYVSLTPDHPQIDDRGGC